MSATCGGCMASNGLNRRPAPMTIAAASGGGRTSCAATGGFPAAPEGHRSSVTASASPTCSRSAVAPVLPEGCRHRRDHRQARRDVRPLANELRQVRHDRDVLHHRVSDQQGGLLHLSTANAPVQRAAAGWAQRRHAADANLGLRRRRTLVGLHFSHKRITRLIENLRGNYPATDPGNVPTAAVLSSRRGWG